MSRLVKYCIYLWDAVDKTGFINIFDAEHGLIVTQWQSGELIKLPQLPKDSKPWFIAQFNKYDRAGLKPKFSYDLVQDFWEETDNCTWIIEDLNIEYDPVFRRIRQAGCEWLDIKQPIIEIDNFANLSLIGI